MDGGSANIAWSIYWPGHPWHRRSGILASRGIQAIPGHKKGHCEAAVPFNIKQSQV